MKQSTKRRLKEPLIIAGGILAALLWFWAFGYGATGGQHADAWKRPPVASDRK